MFKKIKDKLKNNKALMISLVAVIIILIGGVSYAAYDYSFIGNDSKLESGSVSIKFLESNTNVIDLKNALPISDSEGKKGNSFDFVVTTKASYKTGLKYDLSVEKLSVDSGYTSLSDNQVKIYLTDSGNNDLVSPTLISGLDNKLIYSKTNKHSSANTKITDKYKLRVWVDSNVDASNWDQSTKLEYKFKVGLRSEEVEVVAGPNEPVLDNAMIPVYYDESSSSWKKADSSNKDNNWYNYNEKKWANSVTVSSTNRSKYLSAEVGTEIPMKDILTMQVWIPRYKYKVWNYNSSGETSSSPQEIEIIWESETDKTGDITCVDNIQGSGGDGTSETCKIDNKVCTDATCNGKTYTHPAFTFGNEEVTGFWISKFELRRTGPHSYVRFASHPNYDGRAANAFLGIYDGIAETMGMNKSGNGFGLSTNVDPHMIKNMEWGAVAYLSHSKYGTCTNGTCVEVGINNNYNYITGCGAEVGSSISSKCNEYNTSDGMLASTTQNIYGVYDMSGGLNEYTMGNMVSSGGKTMLFGESTLDSYPEEKYYDKYSYVSGGDLITISKLGDGIKEVYVDDATGWYDEQLWLIEEDYPWFSRGGNYGFGREAGLFASYIGNGTVEEDELFITRFIITP